MHTGNCNLVYAIIRKRNVFHQLANLPSDYVSIQKALQRKKRTPAGLSHACSMESIPMEGSCPAVPAEPGTLKTSLAAYPGEPPLLQSLSTFKTLKEPYITAALKADVPQ